MLFNFPFLSSISKCYSKGINLQFYETKCYIFFELYNLAHLVHIDCQPFKYLIIIALWGEGFFQLSQLWNYFFLCAVVSMKQTVWFRCLLSRASSRINFYETVAGFWIIDTARNTSVFLFNAEWGRSWITWFVVPDMANGSFHVPWNYRASSDI